MPVRCRPLSRASTALPPHSFPYQADVVIRSFLLARPTGNVIVYNSPGLTSAAAHVRDAGGSRLLVDHGHEAMYGAPDLDAPVLVDERDRSETARSMPVVGVLTSRDMIDDDLEVIPTPGHTPGTTSYLWDNGSHRFLFTGNFIWIENRMESRRPRLQPPCRVSRLRLCTSRVHVTHPYSVRRQT